MDAGQFILLGLKAILVLGLVVANAFFVAAEFALVRIRETQLTPLIQKGHRRARIAREILGNLDAYISATQLGITVVGLALGALAAPVFAAFLAPLFDLLGIDSPRVQHTISILVGFAINTFLLIVVGELAPKSLAIRRTLPTTLWVAEPVRWFYAVSYPFIWVLNASSQWLLHRFGIEPTTELELTHSEEELRLLFLATQARAGGSRIGRDLVLNALDLRRRVAREVMRPRREIVDLSTRASMADCLETAEKTRYSRFPLCEEGDVDRTLGVVHLKDLYAQRLKARSGADLTAVMRPIIYVPETVRLESLLTLFLDRRLHFAIVVDEYGGTVGMVTLENVLEEIVGQIQDEFDQEKPLLEPRGEQAWELSGALPLHELADLIGESLQEEGINTTSGLLTQRLGGFPKVGDCLALGRYRLRVEEMDGLRVARLKLTREPETPAPPP